jgi:hypothetical protein
MKIVISAPPTLDIGAYAQSLAGRYKAELVQDPTHKLCQSYGFQTVYRMPHDLQRQVRLAALREHASVLKDGKPAVHAFSAFSWAADWMRWFWSATPTEEWENVLTEMRGVVASYSEIYHITDGPQRGYDGYHWLDQRNAAEIERLMRHLYTEFDVQKLVKSEKIPA